MFPEKMLLLKITCCNVATVTSLHGSFIYVNYFHAEKIRTN